VDSRLAKEARRRGRKDGRVDLFSSLLNHIRTGAICLMYKQRSTRESSFLPQLESADKLIRLVPRRVYSVPSSDYKLEYVEVIHRHHKRTPYASNTFPVEDIEWSCNGLGVVHGGRNATGLTSSTIPLQVSPSVSSFLLSNHPWS